VAQDLTDLINSDAAIEQIAEVLDAMSHQDRLAAMNVLGRAEQRRLFAKASTSMTLEHFVPSDLADRAPVIHHGKNTLPLPKKHRLFQKRFCRPDGDASRLFGYNESPSRGLIGPGYFVAHDTKSDASWAERGDIVVDYFLVPDGPVASGWPKVVPTSKGLQMFVYKGTRDFMRRVSAHVSIGAAYKGEKALDHYFVLTREDRA